MKRILLLVTVALMLASAMVLSGVAQAAPTIGGSADAKCLAEAAKALQPSFNPPNYTFHGGTEGDNIFNDPATEGNDVFCGFGGNDGVGTLEAGDIFIGGEGNDLVTVNTTSGTFYGEEGFDDVTFPFGFVDLGPQ